MSLRPLPALLLLGVVLCCLAPGAAVAQYSAYEQSVITSVLAARGKKLDPAPQGKLIESVQIELIDVFDPRDPVPDWLNVFHARTRREIVRRELLFAPGQRCDQSRLDETARNLRRLPQLSLVLVIAVRGSAPDRVQVVVITKDVWSLRFSYNPEVQKLELVRIDAELNEINLAGLHQVVAARFGLDPGSYYLGAAYEHPRLAGSRIRARASGHLIFERSTGRPEGSFGSLLYGQPLYSLDARWAYGVLFAWHQDVEREYVAARVANFDARSTPGDDAIPRVWDRQLLFGQYELLRAFGRRHKLELALGAEASRAVFRAGHLGRYDPQARSEFEREVLPVSDQRASPFVGVRSYDTAFLRTIDLETLSLQEDVALGHDLSLRLYPASQKLGSTRDLLGLELRLGYTLRLGSGLVRATVTSLTELARRSESDALLRVALRLASPRLGFGRLVLDGTVTSRYEDYFRQRLVLGGNGRLRGFWSDEFWGKDLVATNLEYRSPPVELLGAQLGGVLFYDLGDAFDGFSALCPKQGAGAGARLLLPQLNRGVFRLDWGVPLERNRECDRAHGRPVAARRWDPWQGLVLAFEQAFPLPRTTRPSVPENLFR